MVLFDMSDPLLIAQSYLPLPPIWKAVRIHGSMLGFEMGDKILVTSKKAPSHYEGQSYLTIELCRWSLVHNGTEVLNNECEDDEIYESVLSRLLGQQIVKIEQEKKQHIINFYFSDKSILKIMENLSVYEREDVLFTLSNDGEYAISYSVKRGFHFRA